MKTTANMNIVSASLDAAIVDGIRVSISALELPVYDCVRYTVFPGFCDVRVHFREPGFFIT